MDLACWNSWILALEHITMRISGICVSGEWKPLSESGIHADTDLPVFDLGISNVPSLGLDGVWHQFRWVRDSWSVHIFERSSFFLSNQEKAGIMVHEYL